MAAAAACELEELGAFWEAEGEPEVEGDGPAWVLVLVGPAAELLEELSLEPLLPCTLVGSRVPHLAKIFFLQSSWAWELAVLAAMQSSKS